MSEKVKVHIDLDEGWIFIPYGETQNPDEFQYIARRINREIQEGKYIELPKEYVEQYRRVYEQFWAMNAELEELYREHFMNRGP